MKIGLLGATGPAGKALAARLASVGYEITVGSRSKYRALEICDEIISAWPEKAVLITQAANIDAGLRSYMLGVYNHMTIGMAITGFFAYLTKIMSVSEGMLTPFGTAIYASPL